jgi:cyclopropane fatty-acyl-phospholipid synthase-like methyltransferase
MYDRLVAEIDKNPDAIVEKMSRVREFLLARGRATVSFVGEPGDRKTLDEWHKRFWQAIDQLFPAYLSIEDVESWNRYFVLCKAMFRPDQGRSYGVGHYLYEKT